MKENSPRIKLAVASPLLCDGCSGLAGGAAKLACSTDSVEADFSIESVCPHDRQKISDASTVFPHFGQNISPHLISTTKGVQQMQTITTDAAIRRVFVLMAKEIPDTTVLLHTLRRAGGLAEAISGYLYGELREQVIAGIISEPAVPSLQEL